jgi:hypothetical protein
MSVSPVVVAPVAVAISATAPTLSGSGNKVCPHCQAANSRGAEHCTGCGRALPLPTDMGPRVVHDSHVAFTHLGRSLQVECLRPQSDGAFTILLIIALLQTALGALFVHSILSVAHTDFQRLLAAPLMAQYAVLAPLLIGTVFLFLAALSYFSPFLPVLIAFSIYMIFVVVDIGMEVSVAMHNYGADPGREQSVLFPMIILRFLVLGSLGKALQLASRRRKLTRVRQYVPGT